VILSQSAHKFLYARSFWETRLSLDERNKDIGI
jgi:hypothetical protein